MSELSNRKAMSYEYISQFSYFGYNVQPICNKDEVSLKKRSFSQNIIVCIWWWSFCLYQNKRISGWEWQTFTLFLHLMCSLLTFSNPTSRIVRANKTTTTPIWILYCGIDWIVVKAIWAEFFMLNFFCTKMFFST